MAREGMGLWFDQYACWRRKFRWLMNIDGNVSGKGINVLPPQKSARPSLSFKELETQHLNETVYFPGKPDWKPIPLVLYDIATNTNPVYEWIKAFYDPKNGLWTHANQLKRQATLKLLDGCGTTIETWTFDNAWPQVAEFGELDMGSSEVVMCELTLRYDRAYLLFPNEVPAVSPNFTLSSTP